jgi:hypothetical protein
MDETGRLVVQGVESTGGLLKGNRLSSTPIATATGGKGGNYRGIM